MKYPGEWREGQKKQVASRADALELELSAEELTQYIRVLPLELQTCASSLTIIATQKNRVDKLCIENKRCFEPTLTVLFRALNGELTTKEITALQQYPMENFQSCGDVVLLLAFTAKYWPIWSRRKKANIATASTSQLCLLPGWETFAKIWPQVVGLVRITPDNQIKERSVTLMRAVEEHSYYSEGKITLDDWKIAKQYLKEKLEGKLVDNKAFSAGCYNALVLLLERCKQEKLLEDNITIIIQESIKKRDGKRYDPAIGLCDLPAVSAVSREIYSPATIMARFLPLTKPPILIAHFDVGFPEKVCTSDEKQAWWDKWEKLTLPEKPSETPLVQYFNQYDREIGTQVLTVLQEAQPDSSQVFFQPEDDGVDGWDVVADPKQWVKL